MEARTTWKDDEAFPYDEYDNNDAIEIIFLFFSVLFHIVQSLSTWKSQQRSFDRDLDHRGEVFR